MINQVKWHSLCHIGKSYEILTWILNWVGNDIDLIPRLLVYNNSRLIVSWGRYVKVFCDVVHSWKTAYHCDLNNQKTFDRYSNSYELMQPLFHCYSIFSTHIIHLQNVCMNFLFYFAYTEHQVTIYYISDI